MLQRSDEAANILIHELLIYRSQGFTLMLSLSLYVWSLHNIISITRPVATLATCRYRSVIIIFSFLFSQYLIFICRLFPLHYLGIP